MKKTILFILAVFIILNAVSYAEEYEPALGMKMSEFISKYNAIGTPLGSTLLALREPEKWTKLNNSDVAWFAPARGESTRIYLISSDPAGQNLSSGLDRIQISMDTPYDFLSFLTVADRCAQLFAADIFTVSMSKHCVYSAMTYYFENNLDGTGMCSYNQINAETKICCKFFSSENLYYLEICAEKDV